MPAESGDRFLDHAGDLAREALDELAVAAFHHHAQQGLGTGGAQQHASAVAQRLLRLRLRR